MKGFNKKIMGLSVEKANEREKESEKIDREPAEYRMEIKPAQIVRVLFIAVGTLVILNFIALFTLFVGGYDQALGFVPGFHLDKEANIPTFFSSLILLIASFLFGVIAFYKRKHQETYVIHWVFLSFVFLYMSLDEAASFHEHLILPLRNNLNLSGLFYYSWVIAGGFFLLAFTAYYLKFFFALPKTYKQGFFLAGFLYVLGALGMELIGGYYAEQHGLENVTYALITTVEETLELIGVLILIKYLLLYLQTNTLVSALGLSLKK